jgi:hypothetical protein
MRHARTENETSKSFNTNGLDTKWNHFHDKRKKMQIPIELNSESIHYRTLFWVHQLNKETIELCCISPKMGTTASN